MFLFGGLTGYGMFTKLRCVDRVGWSEGIENGQKNKTGFTVAGSHITGANSSGPKFTRNISIWWVSKGTWTPHPTSLASDTVYPSCSTCGGAGWGQPDPVSIQPADMERLFVVGHGPLQLHTRKGSSCFESHHNVKEMLLESQKHGILKHHNRGQYSSTETRPLTTSRGTGRSGEDWQPAGLSRAIESVGGREAVFQTGAGVCACVDA